MKYHFIAIGGSAMHNLAIALHRKGYKISGSDDEIFEPSKSRLKEAGILPDSLGWFPEKISRDLDGIILGMHARADNPELLQAGGLGIRIFSYPEFLFEQSKNKLRVVIGGSHGKTTITSMIIHVLKFAGMDPDFMVGAQLEGFDVMVKISDTAGVMVLEGDEYLTSPLDRRPKFHLYRPQIGLISGIAWDHINVFPTFENYTEQFRIFAGLIPEGGKLVYFQNDPEVLKIADALPAGRGRIPYGIPDHCVEEGVTYLLVPEGKVELRVFGEHNLANINGARMVCRDLGVSDPVFNKAINFFNGASRRLEKIVSGTASDVFKDFAHSPSKLLATVRAVKGQYRERKLVACLELHTYSSLSEKFLPHYKNTMDSADKAIVYYNPHALEIKRLPAVPDNRIKEAFGRDDLKVFTNSHLLFGELLNHEWNNCNLLLMSSGDFDGMDIHSLARTITS
ncbi:MAG: peptidoglycan synthetase [Bacteroidales bacterium]|nr:peptidoglycan synthetase [Bacteroidales bacterium]